MTKNYLYVLTALLFINLASAQTNETFESQAAGSKTFTSNNKVFNISTQKGGSFGVFEHTGSGWNGTATDHKFIDNTGTADFGKPVEFKISVSGFSFYLKSLYLYLSTVQLGSPTGTCTITGKLSGVTVFTVNKTSDFVDPTVTGAANNGYTKIDLADFGSNTNTPIDEFIISTTGKYEYVALDAMNWQLYCGYLSAPTANATQDFCDAATVADLNATGTNLKWYSDNTSTTPLLSTASLTSKSYYVSQGDGSCESERLEVDVTVTPTTSNTTTISTCDEYTWAENSTKYTQTGIYTSIKGCVTEILDLTITPSTSNTTTISTCDEYTWAENSTKYTQTGIYTSKKGCATEILDLTITPSTSNTTAISTCDEYTWAENSTKYTQTGIYTSVKGCDTQVLDLTITPSTSNTTTISTCDEYTWAENSTKYTQTGIYTSKKGCATEILDLTITPSTSNTTTISTCDEYTWAENSTKYTQTGIYTSKKGCATEILDLTITPSTSNTTTISACDEYTWAENSTKYTQTGIYTSKKGCATEILNLTITPTTSNTTKISACDEYTWSENSTKYTKTGIYTSVKGCATEILDLTINTIDKAVSFENGILSSNTPNAVYQWIDCTTNTPISGAVNSVFTPQSKGQYSVVITLGNCVLTSDCYNVSTLGRDQFDLKSVLMVYPNPSHDVFHVTIENNAIVEFFDISGKKLKRQSISKQNSTIDVNGFAAGNYILKITDENNQTKIVKVTKI